MTLKRDAFNNGLVNTDNSAYEEYMITKQRLVESAEDKKKLQRLESELEQIKKMLGIS